MDARRHVLGKLAFRELASVAPTCREFQEELCHSLAKERARLIRLAEDTFGKVMFCAFVRAFQNCMRDPAAYPNLLLYGRNRVVVNVDGELVFTMAEEVGRRFVDDECLLVLGNDRCEHTYPMFGWLLQKGSRGGNGAEINMSVLMPGRTDVSQFHVRVDREAAAVAVGVILSIFTGNAEATPTHWHFPLHTLILHVSDPRGKQRGWFSPLYGAAEKKEAKDLVVPLRLLAASCRCYMPGAGSLRSYPAKRILERYPLPKLGTYPLAHLRLVWTAWWS